MIRNVLNTLGSFRSALAVGVGFPLLMAASANAQAPNTPVQAPTEATTERVIVTGSYIPTAETESALPVTVYTAEVLQKQGANTPVEGLRQLPSFVGNALTENDSNGGDGTANINLRGIGPQNTLTLLNGRRTFNFSDINAIPIGAVSRVEVLKDGAGAIYGSDAVAGVVNFVLLNGPGEKPYEGAELFALYGNTTDTDAHVRQVYLRGGVTGLDGKVSIAAAGEYYSRANLFSRDRDIAITADQRNLGGLNNNSPTYPGRVALSGVGARVLIDQSINNPTPASYRAFLGTVDPTRFNFREFTPAIPAMEKAMYYITGRYKVFGEGLQLYGDVLYSKVKQDNGLAPAPFTTPLGGYSNSNLFVPFINPATGLAFGFLTPPSVPGPAANTAFSRFSNAAQISIIQNSPFNPFPGRIGFNPVSGAYTEPAGALIEARYRTIQELGNRRSFFEKDFYRYVAGANGDFTFKDNGFISRFGYDAGFLYERFDEQEIDSGDATRGGIYREIINTAINPNVVGYNPFIGENAPTRGVAPIYNAAGVQIGTRAYDNTAAALRAAYLGHSFFYERDWLVDAKTNMHLFPNLWNGGVDLAVGYEHRESQTHNLADPTQLAGDQLGFNAGVNYKHVQEVSSVFTELGVPIVTSTMNVPFVRSLDLSIAWRYEKFDDRDSYLKSTSSFNNRNPDEDFGGTPRVSIRYQPIADITLRAGFGQSFLSPSPFSLFSPAVQNFPQVFDPLLMQTLQPPGGVYQGGNPNLGPEHTDAYTAGIVWTPKFIPGFTMTADWYQLFTTDLILPAADFAQLVLTQNARNPNDPLFATDACNNGDPGVLRNADNSVNCINALTVNAGKRFVQGLDVTAVYELPTERFGKFTFSGGWNHFFTWKAEPVSGFGFHNFLGDYSSSFPLAPGGIPFNKAFLRGEWDWHHFDFVATGNYIGDYWDDPNFILGNDLVVGNPGTDAEPNFRLHRHVASYITLDMQLSYEFVKPTAEPAPTYAKDAKDSKNVMQTSSIWQRILWGTTLTVGVNNAFDRTPLTVLGAFNDNYDTSNYSIRNRYWYVSLKKKF